MEPETILATKLFDKTVHVTEYFASVARLLSFELVDTLDETIETALHLRLSAETDFASHVTILDPLSNKHSDLPLPLKPAATTLFLVPAKHATRIRHFPLSLRPLLLASQSTPKPKPTRLSFTVYTDLSHGTTSKGTPMSLRKRQAHHDTPLTIFLPTTKRKVADTQTSTTKRPKQL